MGTAEECYDIYWTNPGSNIPWNNSSTATYFLSLKPFKLDEQETLLEKQEIIDVLPWTLHVDVPVLVNQLEIIYNSFVWTQDVV